ncbi:MAG TPA: alpha/beta hydrolase [Puia sp.]|nr:alpha/beta hydrolase [Puia sp.]
MKKVYCISGLGADERIFSKLKVPGVRFTHLEWLMPLPGEPIEKYAARMMEQVDPEQPVFLGVSFGGMMAIEMAKLSSAPRVILVSSIKSHKELPRWMKLTGKLRLDNLVPSRPWRGLYPVENHFLGTETAEEIGLANDFRSRIHPGYLHWAIRQVLTWRNDWLPKELYHIHGSKDRMFPLHRIRSAQIIPQGGHFMIMNRAAEVSDILSRIC